MASRKRKPRRKQQSKQPPRGRRVGNLNKLGPNFLDELARLLACHITVGDLHAATAASAGPGSIELSVPTAEMDRALSRGNYAKVLTKVLAGLRLSEEAMSLYRSEFEQPWLDALTSLVEEGHNACKVARRGRRYLISGPDVAVQVYSRAVGYLHASIIGTLAEFLPMAGLIRNGAIVEHNPQKPSRLDAYVEALVAATVGIPRRKIVGNTAITAVVYNPTIVEGT